jgi:two-component system response regulator YesN
VEDYILKPFTHDDLIKSLTKVAADLDKEKKQLSDMTQLREELESNSTLMKNKFLSDLVLGNIEHSEAMQKASSLNLVFIARYYKIIINDLRNEKQNHNAIQEAKVRLNSLIKNWPDVISFFIGPERCVCILKGNSKEDIENSSFDYAEAIEHIVTQHLDCNVISSISKTVDHFSQICECYNDADKILQMTRIWNKSRILSSDDVKNSSDGQISLQDKDPLVDNLKYAGKNEIDTIINHYTEILNDNSQSFTVIASYLLVDVIMAVSKLIEELDGNVNEIMPEILQHSFVEESVLNEEVFVTNVRKILTRLLDYRDSRIQGRYGDVIIKAKDYIEQNYASQDTCLSTVADVVHLSPNHFSTIFSQECGITFIEFLTNVRVEAAKKLLKETDMKGSDIAYDCGFGDPHYFSFIFKKTTGMSPREWRGSY